jgi:hypothetical protein
MCPGKHQLLPAGPGSVCLQKASSNLTSVVRECPVLAAPQMPRCGDRRSASANLGGGSFLIKKEGDTAESFIRLMAAEDCRVRCPGTLRRIADLGRAPEFHEHWRVTLRIACLWVFRRMSALSAMMPKPQVCPSDEHWYGAPESDPVPRSHREPQSGRIGEIGPFSSTQ